MSTKNKIKSLSEKVAESLSRNLNVPEYESDSDSVAKIIQFDEEDYEDGANKSFSKIRKQNAQLLSEQCSKYSGEIASRMHFHSSEVDLNNDDFETTEDDQISSENDSEEQDKTYSHSNSVSKNGDEDEEPLKTNLVSTGNSRLEVEKGLCVQNQLAVWEKLLEIRIHSQKILNKANSLPSPNDYAKLSTEKEFRQSADEARKNTELLLEKLIETQVSLAHQFSEIKKLGICARKRSYSKSNTSTDPVSKRFVPVIKTNFEKFGCYRNSVLLKWNDRTKLLAPSGGSKRTKFDEEFDIVKKIDNILTKQDEYIAKSQKVKGNYTLFGLKQRAIVDEKEEMSSPHIYDDTDFYHSQLRELIEYKSNVSSDAYDVTKQFAELQKLRQKMKKKVDTRASKGRKTRYVVHHKLINFMAPNYTTEWAEESKNELFRSLFVT